MKPDLDELFARNSAYVPLYRAALSACAQPLTADEAAAAIDAARSGASQIQSAASILETLVRNAGLEMSITVDGEPYEGTMRDLQADESIAADAQVTQTYHATEAGRAVLQATSPQSRIQALIEQNADFTLGFHIVLERSDTPDGVSTRDLQAALREAGALPKDTFTGMETVHASYFTGALENAGALEWKGGRWHTTDAGREAVA